ncbi:hypothetical protein COCON_G00129100 [Conger conger]|uniref:DUF1279 domain-containing protein n=1 Tax=Conger conger TaxID=82655 RepID=A0A9Q1DDL2_CONCO|nr:hypothetical protein COCON_G00129100 [Conger conger]
MHPLLCQRITIPASTLRLALLGPPAFQLRVGPLGCRCVRAVTRHHRWVSTSQATRAETPPKPSAGEETQFPPETILQRFKRTFKQYGKVMIPVHILTSSMWFGMFYYAAMKGVNLIAFLEMTGFPGKIDLQEHSQGGYALTAYAMFKIATPARYAVTLGGTSLSVKYLRKKGYMSTPPPGQNGGTK